MTGADTCSERAPAPVTMAVLPASRLTELSLLSSILLSNEESGSRETVEPPRIDGLGGQNSSRGVCAILLRQIRKITDKKRNRTIPVSTRGDP